MPWYRFKKNKKQNSPAKKGRIGTGDGYNFLQLAVQLHLLSETLIYLDCVLNKSKNHLNPRAQFFEGRLALNPDFFFFCSKAFSRIIVSVIFRASNHQPLDKKNYD